MPLPNRVDPHGRVVARPERGAFMGNRGCIHRPDKTLKERQWASTRWIVCLSEFRGRQRTVMTPGHYTELFFLDETTALAAGHRPCAECRRGDLKRFKSAWLRGQPDGALTAASSLLDLDALLHAERLDVQGRQRTFEAALVTLPDGVLVDVPWIGGQTHLWRHGALQPWSFDGYGDPVHVDVDEERVVCVLTPPSTVAAIAAGYAPVLHPSATNNASNH